MELNTPRHRGSTGVPHAEDTPLPKMGAPDIVLRRSGDFTFERTYVLLAAVEVTIFHRGRLISAAKTNEALFERRIIPLLVAADTGLLRATSVAGATLFKHCRPLFLAVYAHQRFSVIASHLSHHVFNCSCGDPHELSLVVMVGSDHESLHHLQSPSMSCPFLFLIHSAQKGR